MVPKRGGVPQMLGPAQSCDEPFDLTSVVACGELRDVPQIEARLRTEPREASGTGTVPE